MAKKELKLKLEDVKLQARKDWALVKPVSKQSKETKTGLVRPDSDEDEQKSVGTVVSVGEDINGLHKGDIVIYGTFAGEKITVIEKDKEVEYVFLKDEDIIGFIE